MAISSSQKLSEIRRNTRYKLSKSLVLKRTLKFNQFFVFDSIHSTTVNSLPPLMELEIETRQIKNRSSIVNYKQRTVKRNEHTEPRTNVFINKLGIISQLL